MTLQEFIPLFSDQFEETDPSEINESTDFKNLDEWNSLVALSIIALADEKYNVSLKGDDLQKSRTVRELFEKIMHLKSSS